MTGLPIIETKAGDVSAYIPTNVISITDGQIYLQADLFNANVRPAIDVGVSVSRVGGAAQIKAMKSVAGRLRLDLAQFRELEAFASFSSDLDAASRATLDRGQRLVELLKQGQYSPFPVEREVVSLWLGTTGKLDRVPVGDVRRFEAEFLDFINLGHKGIFDSIRQTRALDDETVAGLESAVQAFLGQFTTAEGESLLDDEQVEPMDAADRGQERVQVKKSD
jgi:F-type H+-transporting ATPase subunit alpha